MVVANATEPPRTQFNRLKQLPIEIPESVDQYATRIRIPATCEANNQIAHGKARQAIQKMSNYLDVIVAAVHHEPATDRESKILEHMCI